MQISRTSHALTRALEFVGAYPGLLPSLSPFLFLGHTKNKPLCMFLLTVATSMFVNFSSSIRPMCMRKTMSTIPRHYRRNQKRWHHFIRSFSPSSSTRSNTPLHFASTEGHADVCEYLVASKADAAARDRCVRCRTLQTPSTHMLPSRSGDTPLKVAVIHGKSDVEAYLRGIGAPE